MKRWVLVVLLLGVVLIGGFFTVVSYVRSTRAWARALELPQTDLAIVADGVYEGTARLRLPRGTVAANSTATVRVTVRDHRYEAVEVIAPQAIARQMTDFAQTVVSSQSLRVDTISGATVTKTAVLMAIAHAVGGS